MLRRENKVSALHVIRASLAANVRAALTGPSGGPPGRRAYVVIGAIVGTANFIINIIQTKTVTLADIICMVLALAALILKNLLSRSQKSVLHRNVALIAKILLAVSLAAALLELAIRN